MPSALFLHAEHKPRFQGDKMHDAIIIGAGVAGSPTGLLAARAAHKILLLDKPKATDNPATEIMWTGATAKLDRWGLLEEFQALGAPPLQRVRVDLFGTVLSGSPTGVGGVRDFYVPRRAALDKLLLEEAARVGVEVRQDFEVTEIVRSGTRVTGVRGKTKSGETVEESAKIVVGADGRNSVVAQAVKAELQKDGPAGCAYYYALWSGVKADSADVTMREGRAYGWAPTHDGLTRVFAAWSEAAFPGSANDVDGTYQKVLKSDPRISDLLASGKMEGKILGTGFGVSAFMRASYGPGWALVGDAGYYENPLAAHGIMNAFRDAEWMAMALDNTFSGRSPAQDALRDFEVNRNEAETPLYESAGRRSTLSPSPENIRNLIKALEGKQDDINAFFGVDVGTVAYSDFFTQENLQRIAGKATAS
jgi:flavin-dependent dehydrogenase